MNIPLSLETKNKQLPCIHPHTPPHTHSHPSLGFGPSFCERRNDADDRFKLLALWCQYLDDFVCLESNGVCDCCSFCICCRFVSWGYVLLWVMSLGFWSPAFTSLNVLYKRFVYFDGFIRVCVRSWNWTDLVIRLWGAWLHISCI